MTEYSSYYSLISIIGPPPLSQTNAPLMRSGPIRESRLIRKYLANSYNRSERVNVSLRIKTIIQIVLVGTNYQSSKRPVLFVSFIPVFIRRPTNV